MPVAHFMCLGSSVVSSGAGSVEINDSVTYEWAC